MMLGVAGEVVVAVVVVACGLLRGCLVRGLNVDGVLLLGFKYSVLADPMAVMAGWSYDDETPCSWNGVMCTGISTNTSSASRVISLVLPNSQLLGSIAPDLGLLEHLRHLDLSGNSLNGTLPGTLFNASELRILTLANNEISGEVPDLAGNASSLQVVDLSDNALTGGIPAGLAAAPNLTVLSLANNYISGEIPGGGGFRRVKVLDLSSNLVNGSLPSDLAGGEGLRYLNLSYNRLTGEIPARFGAGWPTNATIDLSFNNLTGEIPNSGVLLSQKGGAFAGNQGLCGKPLKELCPIPSTLSQPPPNTTTTTVPLPGGATSPPAFAAIPKNPNGSGAGTASGGGGEAPARGGLRPAVITAIIAGDLAGLGLLLFVFLYVYQNKKKKQLRQQQQQPPPPQSLKLEQHYASSPAPAAKGAAFFPWCCRKSAGEAEDTEETSDSTDSSETEQASQKQKQEQHQHQHQHQQPATLVIVDGEMELELETLLKASAYILGATGASIVYKAVLADGTALAVRRIGESCSIDRLKEFESQVRSIAKLRHTNLLRLRGFYWGADEKLLIYDYAPNGSLANISFSKKLGSSSSPYSLSWEARLRIARGVARGLSYLHEKKCVHGNIKPTNILLGHEMEPMIGDIGLDRLLSSDVGHKGSSARHFGSKRSTVSQSSLPDVSPAPGASPSPSSSSPALPYQAPEYLKNLKPNFKWDVYSFGMVLLELVAGRLFSEKELAEWNAGFVVEERNRLLRMADPTLRGEVQGKEESLLACFKLGFACAAAAPQRRPSMKDALQMLDRIPSSSSSSASV